MATQVSRWVTNDGKEFDSSEKAKAHEDTVKVIRRLRPRASNPTDNQAVYSALFDAFLHNHIMLVEDNL